MGCLMLLVLLNLSIRWGAIEVQPKPLGGWLSRPQDLNMATWKVCQKYDVYRLFIKQTCHDLPMNGDKIGNYSIPASIPDDHLTSNACQHISQLCCCNIANVQLGMQLGYHHADNYQPVVMTSTVHRGYTHQHWDAQWVSNQSWEAHSQSLNMNTIICCGKFTHETEWYSLVMSVPSGELNIT